MLHGYEISVTFGFHNHANLVFIASMALYLHDHIPVSGHDDNIESLPIIYLFPLHTTVLLKRGTNQISPMSQSLIGDRR